MEVERRGDIIEGGELGQPLRREELRTSPKAFAIPKRAVFAAWQRVKANRGAAGIDGESLAAFEQRLRGNLYRVWNRLVSGSYFPPPVKEVGIPKAGGGVRPLGIPTVGDRVAQTVAKMALEPQLDPHFDQDSYGYRPGKSAKGAVAVTRQVMLQIGSFPVCLLYTQSARGGSSWLPFRYSARTVTAQRSSRRANKPPARNAISVRMGSAPGGSFSCSIRIGAGCLRSAAR
jgi:hypothetical protein